MGKAVVLCCAIAALFVALNVNAATISAVQENNFQVLYLDYPSFVTEFHYNWYTNNFYAFGGRVFRQITHANAFSAIDNTTLWQYDQPFLDVSLFSHPSNGQMWAIGPSLRDDRGAIGYFLPLTVVGPGVNHYYQGDHRGYVFSAVNVDYRNLSNVIAYFAGFGPSDTLGSDSIDFLFVRARLNLNNFQDITWSNTTDTAFLKQNNFHPYCSTFKPKIWHDWQNNKSIIYNPDERLLWQVDADPYGRLPLRLEKYLNLSTYGYNAGTSYHWQNDTLYFGFSGHGTENGTLVEIDLKTFNVARKLTFKGNYSNPRAMAGRNGVLYVGFEGGPGIVSVDLVAWKVAGYVMVPSHLNSMYSAWDEGTNYVYFATYEQKTKVFRVDKADFCSDECWGYGSYCSRGSCMCSHGYTKDPSTGHCAPEKQIQYQTEYKKEEGAAIAMGILFAFMTIAAVAGWVMWYRTKSGNYQRVM